MILALLANSAFASVIQADYRFPAPDFVIDFSYTYTDTNAGTWSYSGSETFTFTNLVNHTNQTPAGIAENCGTGWARNLCWTGTWSTGDGATGTFVTWADKNNAAVEVTQNVRLIEGSISTTFNGLATVAKANQGGAVSLMAGTITVYSPYNSTVTGTWTELAAGPVLPPTDTSPGNSGGGGRR